jgi:hypothetical protein
MSGGANDADGANGPNAMNHGSGDDPLARKASFGQTMRAVAWSFFGVRRRADYERDVSKLNPVHVLVAGIVGAALFVLALIMIIRWVLGSGVAA